MSSRRPSRNGPSSSHRSRPTATGGIPQPATTVPPPSSGSGAPDAPTPSTFGRDLSTSLLSEIPFLHPTSREEYHLFLRRIHRSIASVQDGTHPRIVKQRANLDRERNVQQRSLRAFYQVERQRLSARREAELGVIQNELSCQELLLKVALIDRVSRQNRLLIDYDCLVSPPPTRPRPPPPADSDSDEESDSDSPSISETTKPKKRKTTLRHRRRRRRPQIPHDLVSELTRTSSQGRLTGRKRKRNRPIETRPRSLFEPITKRRRIGDLFRDLKDVAKMSKSDYETDLEKINAAIKMRRQALAERGLKRSVSVSESEREREEVVVDVDVEEENVGIGVQGHSQGEGEGDEGEVSDSESTGSWVNE